MPTISLVVVLALSGCSSRSQSGPDAAGSTAGAEQSAAVSLDGPSLEDHWHAAFGIFVCDKYLPNFDASILEDTDGIHGHNDGLVHIHPFTEKATGTNAILQRFTDAIGMSLTENELKLDITDPPIDLKNGDACANGRPGRLRVVDFSGPALGTVTEVENPLQSRFTPDRVFAFVFAPDGAVIPPPPSVAMLDYPEDTASGFVLTPELRARLRAQPKLEPLTEVRTKLAIEDVELGSGAVVGPHDTVGLGFLLVRSDGGRVDGNWTEENLLTFKIGMGREVPGLEQGVVGMRVGGVRKIVVPSALGYGEAGMPPFVRPNEALIYAVQVLVAQPPKFAIP